MTAGKYSALLEYLTRQFKLDEAIIFQDNGKILARKNSYDKRLLHSVPQFLNSVAESRIRKKYGEFYAINFYSSEQKIIYLYLLKYRIYFALRGDQNLNLKLIQLYLPEIALLIEKSKEND